MGLNLKSVLSGYILLELLNSFVFELDDRTAPGTNEVVMMRISAGMFVTGETIFESTFLRQSRFSKKFQRPVHCRIPNAGMHLLYPEKKFFSAQVLPRIDKSLEDFITLSGRFEAFYGKIRCQMLCRFFPHNLILITIFNLSSYTMPACTSQANLIPKKKRKAVRSFRTALVNSRFP